MSIFSLVGKGIGLGARAVGRTAKLAVGAGKLAVGTAGLAVKGVGALASVPGSVKEALKAPKAVKKLIKKGAQSQARKDALRREGRTKKDLGIAQRNIRDWKKDISALDTSTSGFGIDTTLDELEGYVASAEGKAAYDKKELDKITTAISASRQREMLLREKQAAPASSQFDFNTVINKDNLFNK